MKRYYSKELDKLMLSPKVEKPILENYTATAMGFFDKVINADGYEKDMKGYNTWLSSGLTIIGEHNWKDLQEVVDSGYQVRVRAIRCSSDAYWYKERLGELFEFEEWDNGYKVKHGIPDVGTGYAYIQYEDAELVAIPKKEKENLEPNVQSNNEASVASHSCTVTNN